MVYNLVIRVASDQVDGFILTVAYVALITSVFSLGVSFLFLIDYFKRHSWMYKHKKRKIEQTSVDPDFEYKKRKS